METRAIKDPRIDKAHARREAAEAELRAEFERFAEATKHASATSQVRA
jgi:hypothetical protein